MKTLVAGVGNIFLGDDGFGSAVIRAMAGRPVPGDVDVVDFGIRGIHLAYQLLDGYDRLVLVDAAPRGRAPGTVSLLEVDQAEIDDAREARTEEAPAIVDAHGMEPAAILGMLGSLGGDVTRVLVVACEPLDVSEGIGLSDVVQDAIPDAVDLVARVVVGGAAEDSYRKEASR